MAHVGLVHCDLCGCKVKGFRAISSIERNVSMRHLQGVQHMLDWCIVTLASRRLKASVRFPLLRGMYQKEALARVATRRTTKRKHV